MEDGWKLVYSGVEPEFSQDEKVGVVKSLPVLDTVIRPKLKCKLLGIRAAN